MKLIYITSYDLNINFSGVTKKIKMQQEAFQKADISVFAPKLYSDSKLLKVFNKIPLLPTDVYLRSLFNISNNEIRETDCIYIRKLSINGYFIKMLKRFKRINKDVKIVMEIPTYPYEGEIKGILGKTALLREKLCRKKLKKYIDRIVTYSKDEEIFEIKTIQLSNAIDTKSITPRTPKKYGKGINIIAVAMFSFWHGYDRFLRGLKNYYDGGGSEEIVVHFVGKGEELERYKLIVSELHISENVVFHGGKYGTELNEVYDLCRIGLDAMGRHRVGVYYNSSLKGKEYGAKGLPIISGVETELDSDTEYKYYYRVSADEQPLDINEVIKFYHRIYNERESEINVIKNINEYTKQKFDISVAWGKVIEYVKKT